MAASVAFYIQVLCSAYSRLSLPIGESSCYPVYTFVYNAYKNPLTRLFIEVDIVDTDVYNVDVSARHSRGDVSKNISGA